MLFLNQTTRLLGLCSIPLTWHLWDKCKHFIDLSKKQGLKENKNHPICHQYENFRCVIWVRETVMIFCRFPDQSLANASLIIIIEGLDFYNKCYSLHVSNYWQGISGALLTRDLQSLQAASLVGTRWATIWKYWIMENIFLHLKI